MAYEEEKLAKLDSDAKQPAPPHPFHIFVQESAGCGKTFLIKAINKLLRNFVRGERQVVRFARFKAGYLLAAPTGCAAANIKGTTIHELLGFRVEANGSRRNLSSRDPAKKNC